MPLRPRIRWQTLAAQSAVIVASILLAFSVDAWWAGQLSADKERAHLRALRRDFEIARGRATSSLEVAERGRQQSLDLFLAIKAGKTGELGRAVFTAILAGIHYEVFSAPRGAYDTMVGAGEVELLADDDLKRDLADFYGGFEDMRVSERQLLEALLAFQASDVFAEQVHWSELGYSSMRPDAPLAPAVAARVASWPVFGPLTNWLCLLSVHHDVVAEDYRFLRERIDRILGRLTAR